MERPAYEVSPHGLPLRNDSPAEGSGREFFQRNACGSMSGYIGMLCQTRSDSNARGGGLFLGRASIHQAKKPEYVIDSGGQVSGRTRRDSTTIDFESVPRSRSKSAPTQPEVPDEPRCQGVVPVP